MFRRFLGPRFAGIPDKSIGMMDFAGFAGGVGLRLAGRAQLAGKKVALALIASCQDRILCFRDVEECIHDFAPSM